MDLKFLGSKKSISPGAVLFIILFQAASPKTAKKRLGIIATVGLGFGDFVYSIIALFISVVSCMDSRHSFGA